MPTYRHGYTVDITVDRRHVTFKVDTGANANILPLSVYKALGSERQLSPPDTTLYAYNHQPLDVIGKITLPCAWKDTTFSNTFYVIDTKSPAILSLEASTKMGILKFADCIDNITQEFTDVFQGIGKLAGEYNFSVKPDTAPVVHPPRRVPDALKDKLKKELDVMEANQIVVRVHEPTDWVNSLVVVEKPGGRGLRICLDPRDLNNAIRREYYPIPTLDEITTRLHGAKYFSTLDARSGYWSIMLSEQSSLLTTFNTPFGRYRFLRLPFGVNCAQDVFQYKSEQLLEDISNCAVIIDDILIWGASLEEHERTLREVLQRCRDRGLRLNGEKCKFGLTEVKYFGHILSQDGVKSDPAKIDAIKEIPTPDSKEKLGTFLGMVNYLSKFIPLLSSTSAPLRELTKTDTSFRWSYQAQGAFDSIKTTLSSPVTLKYFDHKAPTLLQVDASSYGLGAVLMQDSAPVAFASKSLTKTEQNYAQIEKELYAIVFGCERFHQYLYGRHFTVETDHKPLETIVKKPLAHTPPRLQRMLLKLSKYDFTVVHRPGKCIPVADALSRLNPLPDVTNSTSEHLDSQIHLVVSSLPISDLRMQDIQSRTQDDTQLQLVKHLTLHGWPSLRKECPELACEFWNDRQMLSVSDGLILRGERLVIPRDLRRHILSCLHRGHFGIVKTKERAMSTVYWPGINGQIEDLISKCASCQENRTNNAREPIIQHPIPSYPFQYVATDMFEHNTKHYLLLVDYYSRFPEVIRLCDTTSSCIIAELKNIFSRHGIPEVLFSDNGPQYTSNVMKEFAKEWYFTLRTSSPRFPQSNGLAERSVRTIKSMLTKCTDLAIILLELRNTPIDKGIGSPAQLLMSRRLRSMVPARVSSLLPALTAPDKFYDNREDLLQQTEARYNARSRPLTDLSEGDSVRVQMTSDGKWTPGTVSRVRPEPRSYDVQVGGRTLRRNRSQINSTGETFPQLSTRAALPENIPDTVISPTVSTPAAPLIPSPPDGRALAPASESMTPLLPLPPQAPPDTPVPLRCSRYGRVIRPRVLTDL